MARVDDYIAKFPGWQHGLMTTLRAGILDSGSLQEDVKWGHPVFLAQSGPVCFFKASGSAVTLGFWRGADFTNLDERLSPHGSFRIASIKLSEGDSVAGTVLKRLVRTGIELNDLHGDPLREPKR